MGVLAKDHRQITLFYHSDTSLGKQTLAYVESSNMKIHAIDISKTKVTGTQWAEIAGGLGIPVSELVNTEHPDFTQVYGTEPIDLSETDWLTLLEKSPKVLACPVLIKGDNYLQIKNPSDFAHFL